MFDICRKRVRKLQSSYGYKVYKNEAAAKRAGARQCGGRVELEQNYDWARRIEGPPDEYFAGWVLKCRKCGHIHRSIGLDEAESIIEEYLS